MKLYTLSTFSEINMVVSMNIKDWSGKVKYVVYAQDPDKWVLTPQSVLSYYKMLSL